MVLWVNISGQLKVFEGVEGNVSMVHNSKHHRDFSTLEGKQLDGSQVRYRAVKTETTGRKTSYGVGLMANKGQCTLSIHIHATIDNIRGSTPILLVKCELAAFLNL